MKTFAVIGLGRFGAAVAEKLMTLGHSVLAIDESQQLVAQLADRVTRAVVADAREEDVLRSLGVQNVDCAVIAIGSDVAASILVTMLCKELGIGQVVCKAGSREHKRALIKLGADRVIIPEQEMGDKLAQSLISGNVLEQIALSEEYSIAELAAPASWAGKTLRALDIRAKYHVSVIALRRGDDITVSPGADAAIAAGDTLVALGTVRDLARVMKRGSGSPAAIMRRCSMCGSSRRRGHIGMPAANSSPTGQSSLPRRCNGCRGWSLWSRRTMCRCRRCRRGWRSSGSRRM